MEIQATTSPFSLELSDENSYRVIKGKILNGAYKIINRTGRSKIWEVFGPIADNIGEELQNVVACKKCKHVVKYSYNNKYTTNLFKHKCYIAREAKSDCNQFVEVDSESREICARAVTEWAVANCRSFNIIEDSGFRKMAAFLISVGAKFGANIDMNNFLPHPTTLSGNIAKLYEKYFIEVKTELSAIKRNGFGVTTDMWTDDYLKNSYLAVTIHYIKDGVLNNRLLGLKAMQDGKLTGESIRINVTKTLINFGCQLDENVTVVTDRSANMMSAFRSYNHICCINHLLNNTVEKSIQEICLIQELSNNCTKLVKYFEKSNINSKLLSTLKSFTPTRWNTLFYLLSSIERNWVEITSILQEKGETDRITNINLCSVQEIVRILSYFEETTKKLEGENYPTLHWVYIYMHRLKKVCSLNSDDSELTKMFKQTLGSYLDETVMRNISLYHKIALFLFPPTNKLRQFSEMEKSTIQNECKNLMRSFIDIASSPRISSMNSELLIDFLNETSTNVDLEVRLYASMNVEFHDDFNILLWWDSHKCQFPLLYKVSWKLLAIPASSAASERVFSTARSLISEEGTTLEMNSISVDKIMFLHTNINKIDLATEIEQIV